MMVESIWIGKKKYNVTTIEITESNKGIMMQTYYGKLLDKPNKTKKLVTIEYHKPKF